MRRWYLQTPHGTDQTMTPDQASARPPMPPTPLPVPAPKSPDKKATLHEAALMAYTRNVIRASHEDRDLAAARRERHGLRVRLIAHLLIALVGTVLCVVVVDASPVTLVLVQAIPQTAVELADRLLRLT